VTEKLRRMIDRALDTATVSLQAIADETGVSYDTLWAWKNGRRNPSPENLAALADALERRGGELVKLAEQLRKEVGE
jgi:transcriptional regulator with XRE-family HTH domain